ncbi:hypothetical protein FRB95_013560 [Tulasnella sp. JGI-2019a]|nr:hypothetical protein FRB95_013560 [Tulasnella sp. JGI-2019a]
MNSRCHRTFGFAEVPSCVSGTILVNVHIRTISPNQWGRIAPHVDSSRGGFIGTVEAVANDVVGQSVVKVGDVVAGLNETCVDILGGSFEEYANVRPGNLWLISAADAKSFGIASSPRNSWCAIM